MSKVNAPSAGKVLSTLNEDGSRLWLRPKGSPGRFLNARRVVGYLLIVIFIAMPLITINGKPAMLLDLPQREFTILGYTFMATDTVMLMFALLSTFLSVFWMTALFGRVWCGWGCPQTVYMELIFRPLETLIEGGPAAQKKLDAQRFPPRRMLKYAVYGLLAFIMSHIFLAYFVPWSELIGWLVESPFQHPEAFLVMVVMSIMIFIDFTYFREQMCTVACPYARLQSVLVDRHSLIVGYDAVRGEPRVRGKRNLSEGSNACIDCKACVHTCPTGIDIRDGMQLECIACAQCIDACDAVMDKNGLPRGLIRYSSQETLETGAKTKLVRVRTVLYPFGIAIFVSALAFIGLNKQDADVTVLRGLGEPFVEVGTDIRNQLRVKVVNRSKSERAFDISFPEFEKSQIVNPLNPVKVGPMNQATAPVFITLPAAKFNALGKHTIQVVVTAKDGFKNEQTYQLLGPKNAK